MYAVNNEQIRLDPGRASRLIAQRLRETGKSPAEANTLAANITAGLLAVTPAPRKPGLDSWRMIPPAPTDNALRKLAQLKNSLLNDPFREFGETISGPKDTLWRLWKVVYDEGSELPHDVAMTNI